MVDSVPLPVSLLQEVGQVDVQLGTEDRTGAQRRAWAREEELTSTAQEGARDSERVRPQGERAVQGGCSSEDEPWRMLIN